MVPKSKVWAVQATGPLAAYADRFKAALEERGYKPLTIASKLRLMNRLSRWLEEQDIPPSDLDDKRVKEFIEFLNSTKKTKPYTSRFLSPLIEVLRHSSVVSAEEQGVLSTPSDAEMIVSSFHHYLLMERGLAPSTAQAYVTRVQRFLDRDIPGRSLTQLCASDVSAAVLAESEVVSMGAVQFFACALRSFLRFCFLEGVATNLSGAVLSAARRHGNLLPRGIDRSNTQALIDSCDSATINGARDMAILLLLIRLGLRASEVADLRLDDIDWRSGRLTIRGKGKRVDQMPLPPDVGRAITAYLQQRPATGHREVFLPLDAPVIPLGRGGIGFIVRRACARAGIPVVGPHVLRHSSACEMVAAGVPFAVVSETLRHGSVSSTAIYARFNTEALRDLAIAWPVGGQQ